MITYKLEHMGLYNELFTVGELETFCSLSVDDLLKLPHPARALMEHVQPLGSRQFVSWAQGAVEDVAVWGLSL